MRKAPAQVGELDQQVSLVTQALTSDGMGGATNAENVYAPGIWAKVEPLRGRERQASERQEATADYLVTVRYRNDVKEGHIVRWGGRDLDIVFVRNATQRDLYLALECVQGEAV